jgi:hypothetical protein
MDEVSRQIGELRGRLDTFERDLSKELGEHAQSLDHIQASVTQIETRLAVKDNSLVGKLSQVLENSLIKIVGAGFVTVVLISITNHYQSQLDELKAQVTKTMTVVKEREIK